MKDYEIKYLHKKLIKELDDAQNVLQQHKALGFEDSLINSTGELSTYDNHPADIASETFELEKQIALKRHQTMNIKETKDAIRRLENGQYGLCNFCGKDIGYERLDVLPTARLCIQCENQRKIELEDLEYDSPVEEDLIKTPFARTFTKNDNISYDGEDAWQDVQQYGSSSGPQDISVNALIDYDNVYIEGLEDEGYVEEVDKISNEEYKKQLPDSHGDSYDDYVEGAKKPKSINYFGEDEEPS